MARARLRIVIETSATLDATARSHGHPDIGRN
jgi:hypothetical protein